MNQFVKFLIPIFIIIVGVLLKYSKIPNSENVRKFWWIFIVIGSLNLAFKLIVYFH